MIHSIFGETFSLKNISVNNIKTMEVVIKTLLIGGHLKKKLNDLPIEKFQRAKYHKQILGLEQQ